MTASLSKTMSAGISRATMRLKTDGSAAVVSGADMPTMLPAGTDIGPASSATSVRDGR